MEYSSLIHGRPIILGVNNNELKLETDLYEFNKIFSSIALNENLFILRHRNYGEIRIQLKDIFQKWMKIKKNELKFLIYYHYESEVPIVNLGSNKSKKSDSVSSYSDVDKISAITKQYEEQIKKKEIENQELQTLLENSKLKLETHANISKYLEEKLKNKQQELMNKQQEQNSLEIWQSDLIEKLEKKISNEEHLTKQLKHKEEEIENLKKENENLRKKVKTLSLKTLSEKSGSSILLADILETKKK